MANKRKTAEERRQEDRAYWWQAHYEIGVRDGELLVRREFLTLLGIPLKFCDDAERFAAVGRATQTLDPDFQQRYDDGVRAGQASMRHRLREALNAKEEDDG